MPDYPASTLIKNKGKYYVQVTIPPRLREHFGGKRKQLKKSTGTSDLADAKRRQHNMASELYDKLDACQPDLREVIYLAGSVMHMRYSGLRTMAI